MMELYNVPDTVVPLEAGAQGFDGTFKYPRFSSGPAVPKAPWALPGAASTYIFTSVPHFFFKHADFSF